MTPTAMILKAKWLITCNNKNDVLQNQSLVIVDGKIASILPHLDAAQKYPQAKVYDYGSKIVMPGLINSHTHIAMNLFRGLADDMELMEWLNHYIWPAEAKYVNDEFVHDASQLAIAEMIRGGTTCFNDMYFFMHATAKAAEKAGIRAHIGMTVMEVPTAFAKNADEYLEKAMEFYHEFKSSKLVTPTLAPHSTYTVSLKHLEMVNRLAKDLKLKTNIHLQESASEIAESLKQFGTHPLKRLNQIGMVDKNLITIHMTQIDSDDFTIIREKMPSIVHCPESNMKLASGACPVDKLLNDNINVALGTDGAASNNDLDMFSEMRSASFLGKLTANDPKAVSAIETMRMATINGARALGKDKEIGSLEVGKAADVVAIESESVETEPLYHPVSQIVYSTPRTHVTDVWINGKLVMENRQLLTMDEKEIIQKTQNWRKKIETSV